MPFSGGCRRVALAPGMLCQRAAAAQKATPPDIQLAPAVAKHAAGTYDITSSVDVAAIRAAIAEPWGIPQLDQEPRIELDYASLGVDQVRCRALPVR
jgi:hypothetical protein